MGVEYIELPTRMNEVTIRDPGDNEVRRAEVALGKSVSKSNIFVIESEDRRYLVVAAAAKVFENDLEFLQSSLEHF